MLLMDVRRTDGDVTVPLLSLGAMCAPRGGWHTEKLNPSNRTVFTVEVQHQPAPLLKDFRRACTDGQQVCPAPLHPPALLSARMTGSAVQ